MQICNRFLVLRRIYLHFHYDCQEEDQFIENFTFQFDSNYKFVFMTVDKYKYIDLIYFTSTQPINLATSHNTKIHNENKIPIYFCTSC